MIIYMNKSEAICKRQKADVWSLFFLLFFCCIGLINYQIGLVLGAAIKPVHIVTLIIIIYCMFKYRIPGKNILYGVFFLIVPIFPLYRIGDPLEWVKSYAIYFMMVLFCMFALKPMVNAFKMNTKLYLQMFYAVVLVIEILGIIQFFMFNFAHVQFLENVFGEHQFHYNQPGFYFGLERAYSVYYEPSVLAWVVNTEVACLVFTEDKKWSMKQWLLLCIAVFTMVVSISSSGLVFMALLLTVIVFKRAKSKVFGVVAVIVILSVILILWKTTDLMNPLDRMEHELKTENTSGYERYVSSFLYLIKTMKYYPGFGRGLGQQGNVDLIGRIGVYDGIHNAVVGAMVAFGASSLLYIIPAVKMIIERIKNDNDWIYIIIALLAIYTSTGSYTSLDTFIVAITLVVVGELSYNKGVGDDISV